MPQKLVSSTSNFKVFWEVTLTDLPRSIEPALTSWLFRHGCWGTTQKLDFLQPSLEYEAKIQHKKFIEMQAYFPPSAKEELDGLIRVWLQQHAPLATIHWSLQAQQDWLKEWKKHFKIFKFVGLKFAPVWEVPKSVRGKKDTVIVEPGMAFGTGTHATTRFAMDLLRKLQENDKIHGKTLLDVGAGSGILSVVAEKFGASKCVAMDNDPEAWRECAKMFKLNKTKHCRVTKDQLSRQTKQHDVVVANIIDGVLMRLRKMLLKAVKPKGYLILSGILTDGAPAFKKAFLVGSKARIIAEISDQEWTALLISK